MPYASNDALPEGLRKKLPTDARQTAYREAFNAKEAEGEKPAALAGWMAARKARTRKDTSCGPGMTSVHVPNAEWGKARKTFPNLFKFMDTNELFKQFLGEGKRHDIKKGSGLYVCRDLDRVSACVLRGWANGHGLPVKYDELYVTFVNSSVPVALEIDPANLIIDFPGYNPTVIKLTDGSIALSFGSEDLVARHEEALAAGADWSFGDFVPHIVLCSACDWIDIAQISFNYSALPSALTLLGEEFSPASDAEPQETELEVLNVEKQWAIQIPINKIDDDQHLVTGWASVIEDGGEEVFDLDKDAITEKEITKAAHDFMVNARKAKAGHIGPQVGEVVESMVLTKDKQEALGISLDKVGWLITMKIYDEDIWKQVKSGELSAFSIGGSGLRVPVEE